MVIMPSFQVGDGGSIPLTRSILPHSVTVSTTDFDSVSSGSNPGVVTKGGVPEWLKEQVANLWRRNSSVGSNPTLSADTY